MTQGGDQRGPDWAPVFLWEGASLGIAASISPVQGKRRSSLKTVAMGSLPNPSRFKPGACAACALKSGPSIWGALHAGPTTPRNTSVSPQGILQG